MGLKLRIGWIRRDGERVDRIAEALERLALIASAARFNYQLNFNLEGENMPTYKSDRPDFSQALELTATDSEGHTIRNAPLPAGFSLSVTSDNEECITATQDPNDSRIVHYHVGGPKADGSPSQANLLAIATDPAGNMAATGAALVTVTAGDPSAITEIHFNLPE